MKKKSISIVLLATILMQSCAPYKKTSVPLEQAYDRGKVKVVTTTGHKINFEYIEKENGHYYGTIKSFKYHIPLAEVEASYLFDKKKSNRRAFITIGVIVVTIFFLLKNAALGPLL